MSVNRISEIKERLAEIELCVEGAEAYLEEATTSDEQKLHRRNLDDYAMEKLELDLELDELSSTLKK